MEEIGKRILIAMTLRDMKQSDLTEKTGINKGALSCYISGKYKPKQNNTYLLAKALNVNEEWLMGKDVPMERAPGPQEPLDAETEEMVKLFHNSSPEIRSAALAVLKSGQQSHECD